MSHLLSDEIVVMSEDVDAEEQIRLNRDEESGGGCIINMENEKRMRREIANSNERRRMQSINAGFQSLRSLLPHHEGEKLSKAAILQQTAQYIIDLEREKTHLLSQNCQLKRLIDQHDGSEIHVLKKRKLDNVFTIQTISDSSDEGLGSMSPEPITLLTTTAGKTTTITATAAPKEIVDLKNLLDAERRQKLALEERLRQIELQIYPERCRDVPMAYQHQEVIEHTDNVLREDDLIISDAITKGHEFDNVQVVSIDSLPSVGQTQVVVCTNDEDDMVDEDSRTATPCEIEFEHEVKQEVIISEPCRFDGSDAVKIRLQPILEAAIKAEPKVEVERINSPASVSVLKEDTTSASAGNNNSKSNTISSNGTTVGSVVATTTNGVPVTISSSGNVKKGSRSRMFIRHNTSRQNLETIVEAIRHLEGDQLFGEIVEPAQEVPLALTNKPQRQLQIEMNPFLQFRTTTPQQQQQQQQQQQPLQQQSQQQTAQVVPATVTVATVATSITSLPAAAPSIAITTTPVPASAVTVVTTANNVRTSATNNNNIVVSHLQQQQQCRPGVIVVKQSS